MLNVFIAFPKQNLRGKCLLSLKLFFNDVAYDFVYI